MSDVSNSGAGHAALEFDQILLSEVIESAEDCVICWDSSLNCVYANRASGRICGVDGASFTGKPLSGMPLPICGWQDRLEKVFNKHTCLRCLDRFGEEDSRELDTSLFPVMDEAGKAVAACAIIRQHESRPVEEKLQRLLEAELAVRHQLAQVFMEASGDQLFHDVLDIVLGMMKSRYGYFGYINQQGDLVCPSMTRGIWHQCEITGKSVVFPREAWAGLWGKSLKERQALMSNEGLNVPEGHIPLERAAVAPVEFNNQLLGQIAVANKASDYTSDDLRMLKVVATSIAPVLHARLQLASKSKQWQQLASVIEQAASGVLILNHEGEAEYCNASYCKICGLKHEEVTGKVPAELAKLAQACDVGTDGLLELAAREGVVTYELELKTHDKRQLHLEVSLVAIRDELEGVSGYNLSVRNISEQVMLQQQLRQSQKPEALGTLAGGIAHDFNNVLFAMLGYSEMVRDTLAESSKEHEQITEVIIAGKRARDLIKQILTFSRQSEQEIQPVFLDMLVKEVSKLLKATLPPMIEIQLDIDANVQPVMADATQMHQVLMNLCTNAAQAMEGRGRLQLGLYMFDAGDMLPRDETEDIERPCVMLSISDSGNGIPPELLERIFEPFFTTKEVGHGTGMGLAVVHGIISSIGGKSVFIARSAPAQCSESTFHAWR